MKRTIIADTPKYVGEDVMLYGWVDNIRDHGQVIFMDLRDASGLIQTVVNNPSEEIKKIGREWVVKIVGRLNKRDIKLVNKNLAVTGEIELQTEQVEVISKSEPLPFPIDTDGAELDESIRLKYRYLDLRRKRLQKIMHDKHKFILAIRNWMDQNGFTEVITPLLTSTSPEGARDFLIPSRIHKGKFFVLPQAPQQFKQLLMVGGLDRYFQIAPCARDEDPRADRHAGVFYQIDVEMSFPTLDEIFDIAERLMKDTYQVVTPDKKIFKLPFPRMSYREAMDKYGSDKPDLRFGLELHDITEAVKGKSEFNVFNLAESIKTIAVNNGCSFSKSEIDKLEELAKEKGAKGLAYTKVVGDKLEGGVARFFDNILMREIINKTESKDGDLILFVADKKVVANKVLGHLRSVVADWQGLKDPNLLYFAWVTGFPFYEMNDEGNLDFGHNPFSMPVGGMESLQKLEPLQIESNQYDLVLNGFELASGSIRNHEPETLVKAFEIVGYGRDEVVKKFGGLYNAFHYGAPPHGGWAIGIDRLMMILMDEPNIRDIYAFPLSSNGVDLLMNAPSEVDKKQLEDVGLMLNLKSEK